VYDGALKLLVLLHGVDCVYPLLCFFVPPSLRWDVFRVRSGWLRWRYSFSIVI
jgi:hypothetical protein